MGGAWAGIWCQHRFKFDPLGRFFTGLESGRWLSWLFSYSATEKGYLVNMKPDWCSDSDPAFWQRTEFAHNRLPHFLMENCFNPDDDPVLQKRILQPG
ncbi:MAG: hypothetical protein BMS9Abin30_1250 [Gammaproteobacteria bacterium]|nr:MAG: hypothetical protein BMS9Abin30_1250 [Gammaproteobacteria bacterium]